MPSRINKNGIIALAFIVVLLAVMGGMYLLRKSDEPPKLERPVAQRPEERPVAEEPIAPASETSREPSFEPDDVAVVFPEPKLELEPEPTRSMPPVAQNGGSELSEPTFQTTAPAPPLAPPYEDDPPIEVGQVERVEQVEQVEQVEPPAAEVKWVPFFYFYQKSRCRCAPDRMVYFFPGPQPQPPTAAPAPIFFPPIMFYRPNVVVRTEMFFPLY